MTLRLPLLLRQACFLLSCRVLCALDPYLAIIWCFWLVQRDLHFGHLWLLLFANIINIIVSSYLQINDFFLNGSGRQFLFQLFNILHISIISSFHPSKLLLKNFSLLLNFLLFLLHLQLNYFYLVIGLQPQLVKRISLLG